MIVAVPVGTSEPAGPRRLSAMAPPSAAASALVERGNISVTSRARPIFRRVPGRLCRRQSTSPVMIERDALVRGRQSRKVRPGSCRLSSVPKSPRLDSHGDISSHPSSRAIPDGLQPGPSWESSRI